MVQNRFLKPSFERIGGDQPPRRDFLSLPEEEEARFTPYSTTAETEMSGFLKGLSSIGVPFQMFGAALTDLARGNVDPSPPNILEALGQYVPGGKKIEEYKGWEAPGFRQQVPVSALVSEKVTIPDPQLQEEEMVKLVSPLTLFEDEQGKVGVKGLVEILPFFIVNTPALAGLVKRGAEKGLSKSFEGALNTGLDKWIATQSRILPETQSGLYQRLNSVVGSKGNWLANRATQNLIKRQAEKKGVKYATKQAAKDTVRDIERLLLEEHPAVKGQTKPLANIMAEIEGTAPRARVTPVAELKPRKLPEGEMPKPVTPEVTPKEPWQLTEKDYTTLYPRAGGLVDGREVLKNIPNQDSIYSTLENPTIVEGIREIPMAVFGEGKPTFYSSTEETRTKELANEIAESGGIAPLIVGYDATGTYIIEGGHRLDALKMLGAKSFPAQVVIDEDSFFEVVKRALAEGKPVPPEVLSEYEGFLPTPEGTPPVTEPGQPEAGLQAGMMGVAPKEVRPVGKGVPTQILIEDQLKLQQMRGAEGVAAEVIKGTEPGGIKTLSIKDNKGEVISSLAFTVTKDSIILDSMGTVESVRQQGFQTKLWEELALSGKPIKTRAGTLTDAGEMFIQGLRTKGFNVSKSVAPTGMTQYTLTKAPTTPPPEAMRAVSEPIEGVTPPVEPPAVKVDAIQEQGRIAPLSVKPPEAKYSHTELNAPDGPKPPKPPRPTGIKPRDPDDIIKEIADNTALGERPDQAIIRIHEAARNNITRRTNIITQKGDQKLKEQGIGVVKRGYLVPRETDKPVLIELYNALHNPSKVEAGEIAIPAGFEDIYLELRGLANWDTASRLDFDPGAATLDDWFFRGWKPPEGMFAGVPGRGRLVTKPKALVAPRVDATFMEMIDAGFEPLFWNPYQQWGYRHNLGEVYREQMELVSYLKSMGNELIRPDSGGALPVGWKVPRIGPAFEGKPFSATDSDGNSTVMFTRRWIVPDKVANSLESIYGKRPDMGKIIVAGKTIDPMNIIDFVTFVPKRAKLFLSFFQQMDFLNRAGGGSWAGAIDNLIKGKPIDAALSVARYPKTVVDVITANFSPSKRLSLMEQLDDTTPLVQGRPGVHLKGISEAGLSTMDFTIFATDMDKMMRLVAEQSGVWDKMKGVGSSIVDLESAMRRGLFGGTYPAAMITDIKNNFALMMVKQHPTATDGQINAMIAREINKRYSTITPGQSIIQNTFLRETLRRIAFSAGESEALLRQATGMFHGPHKAFWTKQNLGIILFVLAVANIIHVASTGKPLPEERYVPIAKDNWGPLPFGYNTKFAAPTLPWKGRGRAELTLDLMGQMDTAFRVLDPSSFTSARASVPVRTLMNQVSGTDFYGAPIDDVGPGGVWSRTVQFALDMFNPIGIGGITVETLRRAGAEDVIPKGETRLGMLGLGLQATGVNIRAEGTRELLDRAASLSGFIKRDGSKVENWNELEPFQKDKMLENEALVTEINTRGEISAERGLPGAKGYAELKELDQQRIARGEALVTEFYNEEIDASAFRGEVTKLKVEIAARKSQVDEDFQLFQDTQELPEDPNKRALVEYYSIYDRAQRESQSIDWDKVEQFETRLRASWTDEQEAYVDDNIGRTKWGSLMQEYIEAQETLKESGYWDLAEPNQYEKQMKLRLMLPDIEAVLTKWYGYKPVQIQRDFRSPKPKSAVESLSGTPPSQPQYSQPRNRSAVEALSGAR